MDVISVFQGIESYVDDIVSGATRRSKKSAAARRGWHKILFSKIPEMFLKFRSILKIF